MIRLVGLVGWQARHKAGATRDKQGFRAFVFQRNQRAVAKRYPEETACNCCGVGWVVLGRAGIPGVAGRLGVPVRYL